MSMHNVGLRSPHQAAKQVPFPDVGLGANTNNRTLDPIPSESLHKGMLCRVRFDHGNHRNAIPK